MVRIFHQREKCIGCGYCVEVAPNTWIMDSDGRSFLLESKAKKNIYMNIVSDDEFENNRESSELCPVNIIKIEKF